MAQDVFDLPGPKGNSLAGNLLEMGADPLGFLTHCARNFDELVPMQLGLTPACLVNQPDLIEAVLRDRDTFIKSRGFRVLKTLLGEGLLTAEGDSWFWQRKLAQPVFHQQRIHGYGHIMVDYTRQMLQGWGDGDTLDIHREMMALTLRIVMKCIFDKDVNEGQASTVAHALDVAMDWFENKRKQGFLVWEWFPRPENIRYRQAIARMDEAIYALIQERREHLGESNDLLTMLMQAEDDATGERMDDKLLRDEVATLMLAGHETTANALSWTWMLLSQNPQVWERLQHELETVLQGRPPAIDDLPQLSYTSNIIKESMRLYPPVSLLGREVAKDTTLGDYQIPQGMVLLLSQWVMHRSPDYFDQADQFWPERWDNNLEKSLPRGVYFPFGDGPRICIGKGFAQMEAVLLLATIAQQFRVQVVPGFEIVPQPSITLRPETGIQVTLNQLTLADKNA
ncbi:cytochrome P450 [Nodosilinea sp. AN01ver1]|uniref:cytochrome P450 n=1 Tax=Nodosilinea sp. AN01ver1 TaxID=3423362 RepID=UPI003D324124